MDTELARTFLVVVATGSIVAASHRLHVTQSTVSTRIQRLEETLGADLFVRNKAGTTLTPAGQRFQRHASLLTRTVEQARHEIGVISGFRATLNIGWLGLQRLLMSGGTGYFPARMLRAHELTGRVHRVSGAPEFRLPAYLCFPAKTESETLSLTLETIRRVAAEAA